MLLIIPTIILFSKFFLCIIRPFVRYDSFFILSLSYQSKWTKNMSNWTKWTKDLGSSAVKTLLVWPITLNDYDPMVISTAYISWSFVFRIGLQRNKSRPSICNFRKVCLLFFPVLPIKHHAAVTYINMYSIEKKKK